MKLSQFLKTSKDKSQSDAVSQAWFDACLGRGTLTNIKTGEVFRLYKADADSIELLPDTQYRYQYGAKLGSMCYYEIGFSLEAGILSIKEKFG